MPDMHTDWPTPHEYDEALVNRHRTFYDPTIRNGQLLEVSPGHPLRLNGGGSQHVCVYKVGNSVVRCFASEPPNNIYPPKDIVQRQRGITMYFRRPGNTPHFLVHGEWIERGINIKGTNFPFLKLPYIANNQTLGDFLSEHYQHQQAVGFIAREWLKIIALLEAQQIAHGDLDLSNVLVKGTYPSLELYLVDFDGMYVPDFAQMRMTVADNGHANFQPAQPGIRNFGPSMDRFSALIIYLSLCALEINPALWEDCEANDRCLLLKAEDFQRLAQSKNFPRLRRESNNQQLQRCLDELQAAITSGYMPRSLTEILRIPGGYAPVSPLPTTSTYTGRFLEIPLDDDTRPELPSIPVTTPSFSSNPPSLPQTSPGNRGRIIAIIILIIIAAAVLLWWLTTRSQQQPGAYSAGLQILLLLPLTGLANYSPGAEGLERRGEPV